jgi:leader peptidase (prepilin peptidase)/N-methyltransferase
VASFSSDHPAEGLRVRPPRLAARDVLGRLPPRYPAALVVALPLVALVFARFGASGRSLVAAFLVTSLAVLSAIDIAERRLPNRIVLPSAAIVLAAQTALFPDRALEWALAAAGASLVLLSLQLVYPVGLGMGDVKLALLLGAALGAAVVTAFALAFVAAGVYALGLMARYGLGARRRTMPLGPFLAAGAIAALLLL